MDPIERNRFLIDFTKVSPSLNCLILNHSGPPERLQTNLTSVDLFCTTGKDDEFINYCLNHPNTRQVKVTRQFYRRCVEIEFSDASEARFYLLTNVFRKGLKALPGQEFVQNSAVNEYGMLAPSVLHHFEYILLKYQFAGIEFPDRYQKYFSSMPASVRADIFRYLQGKYNFIFNTIEDVYKPKATARLKILIGLRARKENSLIKMIFRSVAYLWFRFTTIFFKRQKTVPALGFDRADKTASKNHERQAAY